MLHSLNATKNYKLITLDGEMGYCKDFLFNDEQWNLHYLLADTHRWFPGGQKMLIHTRAISKIDAKKQEIHLNLSKQALQDSPSLMANDPISRAYEKTYMCYFDYASYHVGPDPLDSYFTGVHPEQVKLAAAPDEPKSEKNHIHSAHFVEDYDLDDKDNKHGQISDFVFDDQNWDIQFLAIQLGNSFTHSKPVLLEPSELEKIDWPNQQVHVALPTTELLSCPVFQSNRLPTQDKQLLVQS